MQVHNPLIEKYCSSSLKKKLQQVAEYLVEKTMAFSPDCSPIDNYPHVCIQTGFAQLNVFTFFSTQHFYVVFHNAIRKGQFQNKHFERKNG